MILNRLRYAAHLDTNNGSHPSLYDIKRSVPGRRSLGVQCSHPSLYDIKPDIVREVNIVLNAFTSISV